jgi:hypothetical protein
MIVFDHPPVCWSLKFGPSSHLVSDLRDRAAAHAELLAFAARIGLRVSWIQNAGTAQEHFDIFGAKLVAAEAAGARRITLHDLGVFLYWRRFGDDNEHVVRWRAARAAEAGSP